MKDLMLKCHPTATPPVTTEAGGEMQDIMLMLPPTGLAPELPELVTCARFKQWMNLCKQPHLLITTIQCISSNSLTTVFLLQHCHITNNKDLMFMIRIITSDTMLPILFLTMLDGVDVAGSGSITPLLHL